MDTAILVDELNKRAFDLVKTLNEKHFVFTVAALMKNEDAEDWYIVLGIPNLRVTGSRPALIDLYDIITESNLTQDNFILTLNDIKLLDDKDDLFNLLRLKFNPNPEVLRIPFTGNYIKGVRIPDSIIYQIK